MMEMSNFADRRRGRVVIWSILYEIGSAENPNSTRNSLKNGVISLGIFLLS